MEETPERDGYRWRVGGLAVLAVVEAGLLVSRFSARPLRHSPDLWEQLAYQSYYLSFLAIATVTAVFAFGRTPIQDAIRAQAAALSAPRPWLLFLVLHVLGVAVVWRLTGYVFEGSFGTDPWRPLWFGVWFGAGLGSILLMALAMAPWQALTSVFRSIPGRVWIALLIGLVAGVAGFAVRTFLWEPMGSWTLVVAEAMAGFFTDQVWTEPAEFLMGSPNFVVHIVPECSGYEGVGLIWIFLGGYLWLFRDELRFPQAWLILVVGTVVVWLANAARIAALVAIGNWVSGDIAIGGFHSKTGWLLFCGVALASVAASRRLTFFASEARRQQMSTTLVPTTAYLMPLLVLVAAAMVTGTFAADVDELYGVRIVLAAGVLAWFHREYVVLLQRPTWFAPLVGLVVAALWILLLGGDGGSASRDALLASVGKLPAAAGVLWWVLRVLGFVVVVPLVEELAFRGYLTRRLMSADFTHVPIGRFSWWAFLGSSVAFGALHDPLAGTLAGMLFAVALYRRRRLIDAVVAHVTANGALLLWGLSTGDWSIWS